MKSFPPKGLNGLATERTLHPVRRASGPRGTPYCKAPQAYSKLPLQRDASKRPFFAPQVKCR
jgi:hypothetical protein